MTRAELIEQLDKLNARKLKVKSNIAKFNNLMIEAQSEQYKLCGEIGRVEEQLDENEVDETELSDYMKKISKLTITKWNTELSSFRVWTGQRAFRAWYMHNVMGRTFKDVCRALKLSESTQKEVSDYVRRFDDFYNQILLEATP